MGDETGRRNILIWGDNPSDKMELRIMMMAALPATIHP
jgi:hypothetical protein